MEDGYFEYNLYPPGEINVAWANATPASSHSGNLFSVRFEILEAGDTEIWIDDSDDFNKLFCSSEMSVITVDYSNATGGLNNVKIATAAVNALFDEENNLLEGVTQADIDNVDALIGAVAEGAEKDALLVLLADAQDQYDSYMDILEPATNAVNDLFDTKGKLKTGVTQDQIDEALALVNDLPDNKTKSELLGRISEAQDQFTPVTGITLSQKKVSLFAGGGNAILVPAINPEEATNQIISWESSNEKVATVSVVKILYTSIAVVNPIGAGTATITATTEDGAYQATCAVKVIVPPASVSLSESEIIMQLGEEKTLGATIQPADTTNKKVIWESSNPKIATVNNNGKVTAIAPGEVYITAETEDLGYTDTCKVIIIGYDWEVDDETDVEIIQPVNGVATVNLENAGVRMVITTDQTVGVVSAKRYEEETGKGRPASTISIGTYLLLNRSDSLAGVNITIYVDFDPEKLPPGMNVNNLKLYRYNEDAEEWEALTNQGVNEEESHIWAEVDQFSVFGIFDPVIFGNLSGDSITVSDAIGVLRAIVGSAAFTEYQEMLADVDGSGDITVTDAIMILRYIVGLLKYEEFPVHSK